AHRRWWAEPPLDSRAQRARRLTALTRRLPAEWTPHLAAALPEQCPAVVTWVLLVAASVQAPEPAWAAACSPKARPAGLACCCFVRQRRRRRVRGTRTATATSSCRDSHACCSLYRAQSPLLGTLPAPATCARNSSNCG